MQEFMEAFGSIINRDGSMTQDQIARLFMQIDANSDGGIDWNEFSTYMLMESQVCVHTHSMSCQGCCVESCAPKAGSMNLYLLEMIFPV